MTNQKITQHVYLDSVSEDVVYFPSTGQLLQDSVENRELRWPQLSIQHCHNLSREVTIHHTVHASGGQPYNPTSYLSLAETGEP